MFSDPVKDFSDNVWTKDAKTNPGLYDSFKVSVLVARIPMKLIEKQHCSSGVCTLLHKWCLFWKKRSEFRNRRLCFLRQGAILSQESQFSKNSWEEMTHIFLSYSFYGKVNFFLIRVSISRNSREKIIHTFLLCFLWQGSILCLFVQVSCLLITQLVSSSTVVFFRLLLKPLWTTCWQRWPMAPWSSEKFPNINS